MAKESSSGGSCHWLPKQKEINLSIEMIPLGHEEWCSVAATTSQNFSERNEALATLAILGKVLGASPVQQAGLSYGPKCQDRTRFSFPFLLDTIYRKSAANQAVPKTVNRLPVNSFWYTCSDNPATVEIGMQTAKLKAATVL